MHDIAARQRKFAGFARPFRSIARQLITRRERWGLSLYGWFTVLLCLAAASTFVFIRIYPFLAVTEAVSGEILVVEGWVPDYYIGQEYTDGPVCPDCVQEPHLNTDFIRHRLP